MIVEVSSQLRDAISQGLEAASAIAVSSEWHGTIYGYAVLESYAAQVVTTRIEPKWPIENLIGHVTAIEV